MTKQLVRNVLQTPGGVKIVYCDQNGKFIGDLVVTCINSAAMRAMSEDFRDFTIEEHAALAATDPPQEVAQEVSRLLRQ